MSQELESGNGRVNDHRDHLSGADHPRWESDSTDDSGQLFPTDVHTLESILDAFDEDGTEARFLATMPGFFNFQEDRPHEFRIKFHRALNDFLDRNFSSNLVPESVRSSQLIICLDAAYAVLGRDQVLQVLSDILNGRWRGLLQSVEMAHSIRRWSKSTDDEITHYVRRIVTRVIAGVRERDEHWISLAKAEFGVPDHVFQDNGSAVLFALLIHNTRQAFRTGSWSPFTLASLAAQFQFDTRIIPLEMQFEFCPLWNEILHEAWKGGADSTAIQILREIRHVYIQLHQGTDAAPTAFSARTNYYNPVLAHPTSYRFCNVHRFTFNISVG